MMADIIIGINPKIISVKFFYKNRKVPIIVVKHGPRPRQVYQMGLELGPCEVMRKTFRGLMHRKI